MAPGLLDAPADHPGPAADVRPPVILGIGGTQRPGSTSERALRVALGFVAATGAVTETITASELELPMYDPAGAHKVPGAQRLLDAVRNCDGLIIATPGYHGGISGLLKNALDYLQELACDPLPYCDDRGVGCIVAAAGWQAGATTLTSLRSTVHALRGWPTPLGVIVNSATHPFGENARTIDPKLEAQLAVLAGQVVGFAHRRRLAQCPR
jgi:FMN reductase